MAIRGQRNLRLRAVHRAQLGKVANKVDDSATQQRLTARQPNFRNPKRNQDARHAQVIGKRKFGIGYAVRPRSAIDAPVVAAIGDRDPQIVNGAPEFVGEKHVVSRWSIILSRLAAAVSRNPERQTTDDQRPFFDWMLHVKAKKQRAGANSANVSFPNTGGTDVSIRTLGKARPTPALLSLARAARTSFQAARVGNCSSLYSDRAAVLESSDVR